MSENRLKQLGESFRTKQIWPKSAVFECSCGSKVILRVDGVRSNHTKSCGCLTKEVRANRTKNKKIKEPRKTQKHGMSNSPEYRSWHMMIYRCTSDKYNGYRLYKGRSISVCERWLCFNNFLSDMGNRPDGATLDRINNDDGYCPENCRWASRSEQSNNRRSSRTLLTIEGVTRSICEWSEQPNAVQKSTILRRILAGRTPEEAVFNRAEHWTKKE